MSRLLVALLVLLAAANAAQARPLLLISTENPPDHPQTLIVQRFVERVRACCSDRLDVEHRFGAGLFRDRDVPGALTQGTVGMGVAGTWHLDRFAPDVGVFMMPVLYGRTDEEIERLVDSTVVATLSRRLEEALGVVVLGRWLPLGQANLFAVSRPVKSVDDLDGLRVRSPGGKANEWRLAALGAQPATIAWTDLFPALAQGRVDGLLTTFASLDSAAPWGRTVRHVLEDRQYLSLYVPMVSEYVWRGFDEATRRDLRAAWEAGVEEGRARLRAAQVDARAHAVAAGVRIVRPDPDAVAAVRTRLLKGQGDLAERLRVDPDLLGKVSNLLDGRS